MSHPVLEEILRTKAPVQDHVLRRWQHAIRQLMAEMSEAKAAKKGAA